MNTMNTQIYEEASEWIILHRSDDLDAEAKRRFDTWVRESPQHLKAYLEMSTIWEDVPTLQHDWNPSANELIARAREDENVVPFLTVPGSGGFGVVETVPANEVVGILSEGEESLKALQALAPLESPKLPEQDSTRPAELARASAEPPLRSVPVVTVPASKSTLVKLVAMAAMIVLTVGITGWFYLQRNTYTTDIGEQRTLALEDGSSVELNARTKIRVAYTDDARTIELLQGQALFKVAKDPNRPFIVDSAGTHIRAVGTQFDVYKKSMGTQVTVVEGRVAVLATAEPQGFSGSSRPPNANEATDTRDAAVAGASSSHHALEAQLGEVLLSAGEQILIAQALSAPELTAPDAGTVPIALETPSPAPKVLASQMQVRPANIEAATAWTQQRLVFDFAPLTEVAQEFNRYNRRPMKIECGALRTVPSTPIPAETQKRDAGPCDFNISGSFSSTDPTLLLRFLREQPGIVVTETSDEIRISREDTING